MGEAKRRGTLDQRKLTAKEPKMSPNEIIQLVMPPIISTLQKPSFMTSLMLATLHPETWTEFTGYVSFMAGRVTNEDAYDWMQKKFPDIPVRVLVGSDIEAQFSVALKVIIASGLNVKYIPAMPSGSIIQ